MAHEIILNPAVKKKTGYKYKRPDLTGKFGLSLNFGKKELFVGIAIADIEIETVVKRKKLKVFKPQGKAVFIPS